MKTYEVLLTKSYIINIKAKDKRKAREYAECFTNDIQNISTIVDEKNYKFQIQNIECKINESFEVTEIHENN